MCGAALSAVDQNWHAVLVCPLNNFFDRIDRAQRVRDVRDRHQTGSFIQQRIVLIHQQFAGVVHWNHAQFGVLLFAEHLPGTMFE